MDVTDLLARAVDAGASDLHLATGQIPMLRLDGELQRMGLPPLSQGALIEGMASVLDDDQRRQWAQDDEMDLALELPALGRFRLNLFRQLNGPSVTFRLIPGRIATVSELDLVDVFQSVAQCRDGLILVGGPTGSGKSSTLATLLDQLNRERALHIITLEDPVEVIHASQRSLVNQREMGRHSRGFAQGLRSALRQDPDVIMIGELRDLETIRLALRAAETGHLVLATVHARSATSCIDRLVEVFAAEEKPLVRAMLAESLRLVVTQVLVRRVGGGRVAAREVLVATPAVRNLVREGRLAQLSSVMQGGAAEGMRTMEGALRRLRERGLIKGL
ncbi:MULTISPECIES: type IV pilus twitching motility protein PilT [Pseudomonas]|jgi:twitching motility protein PilT|nr:MULTISPECIES: PilT/PilU family type 4a pilus ATPase [Pseudomonas]ADR62435.1 Twitching motility protein [Pseudomonas putida BIRD-1]AOX11517.1 twitching motility protein PilT [Pseudomonas putida JB]MCI1024789.1 PilT/PilU family type 4a pilus ATPase [Pseudomonas putida]MDN4516103.1 PilT/PilU family type 4a pilus ATPase [Pseudomonas sp. 2,4-D]RIZ45938.1 twitching motility protein PilT [Pseudomonas putida]